MAEYQGNGEHIYVINDTPDILDVFRWMLEDAGYRVTTDSFSDEMKVKLEDIKKAKPDLLILDYIIGQEGLGWQFLQLLKMDRETRSIPVIICTAAVEQVQQLRKHLDEMQVAVVLKPFDIDRLLEEIALCLERGGGVVSTTCE